MALNFEGLGLAFYAEDRGFSETIGGIASRLESLLEAAEDVEGALDSPSFLDPGRPVEFSRQMEAAAKSVSESTESVAAGIEEATKRAEDAARRSMEAQDKRALQAEKRASHLSGAFKKLAEDTKAVAKAATDAAFGLWRMARVPVGKVATGMAKAAGVAIATGQKFRGAVSGAVGALESLAERAANPDIDTAFSSQYAAFAKAWGEITVGMSLSAKDAQRWRRAISGAAIALNEDMSQLAQAWAAFAKQGVNLERLLGTRGASQTIRRLAKLMSVLGLQGEQLAQTAGILMRQWGMNEVQVRKLMDSVFALGKSFGMGKEVMAAMPALVESLSTEMRDFLKGASPEEIQKVTISIVQLAGGLQRALGVTADQAIEVAKSLATNLATTRRSFKRLFIGLESEVPGITQTLAEAGVDVRTAFEGIQKDPLAFMQMLHKVLATTEKRVGRNSVVYQRLVEHLREAFGDQTVAALQKWGNAQEPIRSSTDALAKSNMALARAVERAFKTGRTMGDSYSLAMQSYQARIKGLTNKYLPEFMRRQKRAFNETYKTLADLASRKGPLGELTRRLLLVQRVGLAGLFGAASGIAPVLTSALQNLVPVIGALNVAGIRLTGVLGTVGRMASMLFSPGGIIIGGLALLGGAALSETFRDGLRDGILSAYRWAKTNLPKFIEKLRNELPKVLVTARQAGEWLLGALGEARDLLLGHASEIASAIRDALSFAFTMAFAALRKAGSIVVGLTATVSSWLRAVDWGAVAGAISGGMRAALLRVGDLASWLSGWLVKAVSGLGSILSGLGRAIVPALKGITSAVLGALSSIDIGAVWDRLGALLSSVWSALIGFISSVDWEGLARTVVTFLGKALVKIGKMAVVLLGKLVGFLWSELIGLFTGEGYIARTIAALAKVAWKLIKGFGKALLDGVAWLAESLWSGLKRAFDWAVGGAKTAFTGFLGWVGGFFASLWETVAGAMAKVGGAFSFLVKPLKWLWKALTWVGEKIKGFFEWVWSKLKAVASKISEVYEDLMVAMGKAKPAVAKGGLTSVDVYVAEMRKMRTHWLRKLEQAVTEEEKAVAEAQFEQARRRVRQALLAARARGAKTSALEGALRGLEMAWSMYLSRQGRKEIRKSRTERVPAWLSEVPVQAPVAKPQTPMVARPPIVAPVAKAVAPTERPVAKPTVEFSGKDRDALLGLSQQVSLLTDAIRSLASRPVVVEITGDLRRFFQAVEKSRRAKRAEAIAGAGI